MINANVINDLDNVAVVIEEIRKGEEVNYKVSDDSIVTIIALNDVKIYHKIAIHDIAKEGFIVKYGEHIGIAANDIIIGEHVHEHNVESRREDL